MQAADVRVAGTAASHTQRSRDGILLIAAMAAALSAVVIDLHEVYETPWARLLAAVASVLVVLAVGSAAADRWRREGPRRLGVLLLGVGAALLYLGHSLGYMITAWEPGVFNGLIEVIPGLIALPIIAVGLFLLVWPRNFTVRDAWGVSLDGLIGIAATGILWSGLVEPSFQSGVSRESQVAIDIDEWMLLVGLWVVIVLWVMSRRLGSLPTVQLVFALGSITILVLGDLLGEVATWADVRSRITYSIVLYIVAMGMLVAFFHRPAVEPESGTDLRVREAVSLTVPLTLGVLAAGFVAWSFSDDHQLGSGAWLAVIGWAVLLVAAVLGRWSAWSDLRHQREQSLNQWSMSQMSSGWFKVLLADSTELLLVLDTDARVMFASPAATTRLPLPDSNSGTPLASLVTDWSEQELRLVLAQASGTREVTGPFDMKLRQRDGSVCVVEAAVSAVRNVAYPGFVMTARDVTSARLLESELRTATQRDRVTGLPSWPAMQEQVAADLATAGPQDSAALVVLDIENFSAWNQSLGRDGGDLLLRAVGDALASLPPYVRTVARLDADSFALFLLDPMANRELVEIDRVTSELLSSLLLADDREVDVKFRAGYVVRTPEDLAVTTESPEQLAQDLLAAADVALHRARLSTRGRLVAYRPGMDEDLVARLALEQQVRSAISEGRVVVFYQPLIRLADRTIVEVEALVRIRRNDGSFLPPDEFIPLAEQTGIIIEMGRIIRSTAMRDVMAVQVATGVRLDLAINVSPREISPELVAQLSDELAATGLEPERLTVEVTESSLHERIDETVSLLAAIRDQGISIAMDDFGTGYSSMSALVNLPVDVLKIDQSFVAAMAESEQSGDLVRAIVGIAASLNLVVVAEGVETPSHADTLTKLGCHLGQGYLFARPMPVADLMTFVAEARTSS